MRATYRQASAPNTQAFNSMVQGIGQASERREMSGSGAGGGILIYQIRYRQKRWL